MNNYIIRLRWWLPIYLVAIPYYYKLKNENQQNSNQQNSNEKNLILVNLSFTDEMNLKILAKKNKVKCLSKTLYKVDARNIENNKENKKFFKLFSRSISYLFTSNNPYI